MTARKFDPIALARKLNRFLNINLLRGRESVVLPGYQLLSEKDQPLGYAALIGTRYVDAARLGGGTPSATTVLRGDYTWAPYGAGDASGPAAAVDSRIAVFDGTTGKLLKDGGKTIAVVLSDAATAAAALYIPLAQKAAASGVASLDAGTLVPAAQLPAATTSVKGAVILSTDGEATAGEAVQGTDSRLGIGADHDEMIFRSRCSSAGQALLLISDRAYFVFVGRMRKTVTPQFVKCQMRVAAAGVQVAEIGFFSSPAAPNNANQTLSKLVATGTVDTFIAAPATIIKNTVAFATSIPAGTYLWAGVRVAFTTVPTQPTLVALTGDMNCGSLLQTSTAGALTAAGPWAGVKITANSSGECPDLIVSVN